MKLLGGSTIVQVCKEMAAGILASRAGEVGSAEVGAGAGEKTTETEQMTALESTATTTTGSSSGVASEIEIGTTLAPTLTPISITVSRASDDDSTVVSGSEGTALFSAPSPVSMMAASTMSSASDGFVLSPLVEGDSRRMLGE